MEIHNQNRNPLPISPNFVRYILIGFAAIIALLLVSGKSFVTIQSGEKGVLFKRFAGGLNVEKIYDEGFHIVMPWNTMYVYDVKIKESVEKLEVLSRNGLNIKVELSYRYFPIHNEIGVLHQTVGRNYHEAIIKPEIRSSTRQVIGKYIPEELYSTKRETIQEEIYTQTKAALMEKQIILDAVLIREVALPPTLQAAIENKLKQEQASLEYEFRIDKQRKEAERIIIEAEAKSRANIILNASLTENILRDKGIEATVKLSESPNAKTIVIGSTKDGLPLILGR